MQFILSALLFVAAVSCHDGICPLYYSPVCGSDGHTYSNKCFFEYAQKKNPSLTMSNPGECKVITKREVNEDDCPEHSKNGICTLEYAPVCASNGQTYGNKCGMCADMYRQRKEGKDITFKVVHPGKCGSLSYCLPRDASGACTMEYMPICGSDGKTYGNRCTFCYEKHQQEQNGQVLTMEYVGECLNCPAMSKHGACPRNYRPVCGSDGKTYANLCTLCVEIYKNNDATFPGLRQQHEGVCETEATLYEAEFCRPEWKSGACTREYNPICGTDGKTYGNPCTFCYAMYQKQANGNDIGVKREGQCQDEDKLVCPEMYKNGICTLEYSPVCGTDGRVYPNKCMFCSEQANKLKEGVEIYFDHYGKCYV